MQPEQSSQYGISSYCLHSQPLMQALEQLSTITDYVEVMDDGPHLIASAEPLESFSLKYALHAPARGVNIASLLEPIRRASVEVLGDCFAIAAEVNAPVVVHPGYFAWTQEYEAAARQFEISVNDLIHLSEEHGVTFFIENMGNWDYFFIRIPSELPLPDGIGLALDVGHANLNHCLKGFLSQRISHFHLHDNNGKEDMHAAFGDGTIDFSAVMASVRRNNVRPIIEVGTYEGVLKSIEALKGL